MDRAAPGDKTQADLWKYGVSGDDPILLVRVYEVEDVPKIVPYIKVFHLLKLKNIVCELVVLYEEGGQYDRPIYAGLMEVLRQYGLENMRLHGEESSCATCSQKRTRTCSIPQAPM